MRVATVVLWVGMALCRKCCFSRLCGGLVVSLEKGLLVPKIGLANPFALRNDLELIFPYDIYML